MSEFIKNEDANISAPWIEYLHKVNAAFGCDPGITVDAGDADASGGFLTIELLCKSFSKCEALKKVLANPGEIGGVRIDMKVTYTGTEHDKEVELYKTALQGNPLFNSIWETEDPRFHCTHSFVLFNNEIVQFFNDDISDYYGCTNMVPEDLFREVLAPTAEVKFNQAHKEQNPQVDTKVGKPLGEWP